MRPLRRQGVFGAAKQHAHIEGMVFRGIEIGEFASPRIGRCSGIGHGHQRQIPGAALGQQRGQPGPHPRPCRAALRHEIVQPRLREGAARRRPARAPRMPPDPGSCRRSPPRSAAPRPVAKTPRKAGSESGNRIPAHWHSPPGSASRPQPCASPSFMFKYPRGVRGAKPPAPSPAARPPAPDHLPPGVPSNFFSRLSQQSM
jgi:hypothetical protein